MSEKGNSDMIHVSDRKREANRRNAQKSTGPKTAAGKATCARNALRHGLRSQAIVVPELGETQGEFDSFAAALFADLHPPTEFHALLAEKLIAGFWKLRRVRRLQTAVEVDAAETITPEPGRDLFDLYAKALAKQSRHFFSLARHERRLHVSNHRTLATFYKTPATKTISQTFRPKSHLKSTAQPASMAAMLAIAAILLSIFATLAQASPSPTFRPKSPVFSMPTSPTRHRPTPELISSASRHAMRLAAFLLIPLTLAAEPADRRIAEFTLAMGGRVRLANASGFVTDVAQLPSGDFQVEVLDWVSVNLEPQDLERLTNLTALKQLHLQGPLWNRNADSGRDGSTDLKYLNTIKTLETITFSYHFLDRIRFRDAGLAEIKDLANLRELVVRQSAVNGHTLAPFHNLEALDVTLCPFDDKGAANLAGMPKLKRLLLGDTVITDTALDSLKSLANLEQLDLHGTPITDAGLANLRDLKNLKKLNLMGTNVSDAGLAHLANLTQLEELNLYRTKVSNTGLQQLSRLRALAELDVRYSRVTRAGIDTLKAAMPKTRVYFLSSPVAEPKLDALKRDTGREQLTLEGSQVDDAALANLSMLRQLKQLNLGSTPITDAGLAHLKNLTSLRSLILANTYIEGPGLANLPPVESLDLHGSPIGNAALETLGKMPNLKTLSLGFTDISDGAPLDQLQQVRTLDLASTDLTDAGLKPLGKLENLEVLVLRESRLTDAGLKHLAPLQKLRSLDLVRTRLTDAGMDALSALHGLQALQIDYGEVYDAGLAKLAPLTNLKSLSLDSTHITDASVPVLAKFTNLENLNLYHTLITQQGLNTLKAALPNCRIVWDAKSNLPTRRRS